MVKIFVEFCPIEILPETVEKINQDDILAYSKVKSIPTEKILDNDKDTMVESKLNSMKKKAFDIKVDGNIINILNGCYVPALCIDEASRMYVCDAINNIIEERKDATEGLCIITKRIAGFNPTSSIMRVCNFTVNYNDTYGAHFASIDTYPVLVTISNPYEKKESKKG